MVEKLPLSEFITTEQMVQELPPSDFIATASFNKSHTKIEIRVDQPKETRGGARISNWCDLSWETLIDEEVSPVKEDNSSNENPSQVLDATEGEVKLDPEGLIMGEAEPLANAEDTDVSEAKEDLAVDGDSRTSDVGNKAVETNQSIMYQGKLRYDWVKVLLFFLVKNLVKLGFSCPAGNHLSPILWFGRGVVTHKVQKLG
jgi:hypothetical protein